MVFFLYQALLRLTVFVLLFVWVFSGWPQLLHLPHEIPFVRAAATPTYVGGAEAGTVTETGGADFTVSLTSLTGGSGSAPLEGDLVIVATGFVDLSDLNPGVVTAGYTEVADLYANDDYDANFSVSWKIMGSTPDTSVTCEGSGDTGSGAVCVVHVWRGVDPATPMDVTDVEATGTNSSVPDSGSITPVTTGAIVIATGLGAGASADTSVTAPSGFGNQVDISSDPDSASVVGIASMEWGGSGAVDPAVWTGWSMGTETQHSWAAVTLALRGLPDAPEAPTLFPDDGGSNQVGFNSTRQNDTTPLFRASAVHTATFDRFQVELNTAADFSGTAYTETFSSTYSSDTPYNLQTTGSLGLPSTNGVTYYVRVRASADGGSSYGDWSSGTWTYTYTSTAGDAAWFQTTDAQFQTGVLTDTEATGSGAVQLDTGSVTIPTFLGVSAHSTAGTGSTRTPDISSVTLLPNDILVAHVVCRFTGCTGSDPTPPASQGWAFINEGVLDATTVASAAVLWKRWGSGDTDDSTPTFTWVNGSWGVALSAFRGADTSGDPYDDSQGDVPGSSTTMTAPDATSSGDDRTVVRLFSSQDNNNHGSNSEGALAYGGTSYHQTASTGYAMSMSYLEGRDGSGAVGTATMTQGSNGPDNSLNFTMVLAPAVTAPATTGTIMSLPIDFDWSLGMDTWGEANWTEDETDGSLSMQVYYNDGDDCDTLIPNGDLSGNGSGFASGPIDLSGLNTTTYNRICLRASFTDSGGSPLLTDWTVTWAEAPAGELSVDIVDAGGTPIADPFLFMSTSSVALTSQVTTGTLGAVGQKVRVSNGTGTPSWSLTVAASSTTAFWDGTSADYDFNDPTANGVDGGDADSLGGQLRFNPSAGTITPEGGCSTTGLSLGNAAGFSEGSVNDITLVTAGGSADTDCYWDLTGLAASSTIPAHQPADTYRIDMILTVTASMRRGDEH